METKEWIIKYFKDTSKPPYWRRITIYISSFFKTSWALMNWLSVYETASGWLIVEQHHAFETSLKTWFLFSCNNSPYFFQAYQLLKHMILTWRTCGSCQFIEIIVRIHHSRQWLFWKKEKIMYVCNAHTWSLKITALCDHLCITKILSKNWSWLFEMCYVETIVQCIAEWSYTIFYLRRCCTLICRI